MNNQYKRILLKLSGESLMGEKQYGYGSVLHSLDSSPFTIIFAFTP